MPTRPHSLVALRRFLPPIGTFERSRVIHEPPSFVAKRDARAEIGVTSIGRVEVEHHGSDLWIVSLLGEHDMSNASDLQARLRDVHQHGTRVILDLSRASFIDSTVIHCIASEAGQAALKPTSDLAVVAPAGSQPRKLLELVHLTTVRVTERRDDALKAVTDAAISTEA